MANYRIVPKGPRILVMPRAVEEVSEGGIVLVKEYTEREQMAQVEATVVDISPDAWSDMPNSWCEVGDTVLIEKYAGILCSDGEGNELRLIKDVQVLAVKEGVN